MKNKIREVDYIIVGQGIAGTLLSYFLHKKGQKIIIIDDNYERASSRLAGGLINPITGRRYVKSWRFDELLPFALKTYRQIEREFNIKIFRQKNFIRALHSAQDENTWQHKSADPNYKKYILDNVELGDYKDKANHPYSYGEIQHAGQTQFSLLLPTIKNFFAKRNEYLVEAFEHDKIDFFDTHIIYKGIKAKKIIFCEGIRAKENPFFNYLPFIGTKGEVLFVKIPDVNFTKIYKNGIFIVPLPNGFYGIGATYDFEFKDDSPTPEGRKYLETRLKSLLKVPFEVIQHGASIRPTVKDRRPFLGFHPKFKTLGIFNGLGTKGASLAPFFANHMVEIILEEKNIDKEVDINRYSNAF